MMSLVSIVSNETFLKKRSKRSMLHFFFLESYSQKVYRCWMSDVSHWNDDAIKFHQIQIQSLRIFFEEDKKCENDDCCSNKISLLVESIES